MADITFAELRSGLRRADPAVFGEAIQYLEEDSRDSGSGYVKEIIWKYIRRYTLQPTDLERLEKIALKYLERPMSHEHKYMFQTLSWIASPAFWQAVESRLNADNNVVALNAYCLFPYSKSIYEGEKQRLCLKRLRLRAHYNGWYKRAPYFSLEDFMKVIEDGANWQNGRLVQGVTESPYIASNFYDEDFTSIDWSKCIPEVLIPALERALFQCYLDGVRTYAPISYIAYAFEKIGNPMAVPILIRYLEERVDYKFEAPTTYTVRLAIFRALREIGTPEAIRAVASRPNPWSLQP